MRSSNCRQYEPGPDNSVQLGVAYSGMQLVLLTTPHPPMPLSHCIVETTSPHADCCAVASKQPPKVTTMIRATCAPRMAGARESRAGAKLRSAAPLPPPMAGGQGGWCQAVARLLLLALAARRCESADMRRAVERPCIVESAEKGTLTRNFWPAKGLT